MTPLPLQGDGRFVRPLRVCFALPEFLGFPSRGGIGQAYGAFAEALAQAGHDVTVLLPERETRSEVSAENISRIAIAMGVRPVFLPELPLRCFSGSNASHSLEAYRAWFWLKDQDFEVIHFTEWHTLGYYCVSAKRGGLAFENTLLCVSLRSCSRWCREGNEELIESLSEMETDFLEKRTAELSDLVFAPSRYIANWARSHGWKLPEPVYHQPNLIRPPAISRPPREKEPVREIVFFGRLQPRKGLIEFCEAIDRLDPAQLRDVTISFLGGHVSRPFESRTYLTAKIAGWPCRVQLLDTFSRDEALAHLSRPGTLAVIASRMETFSNTVHECQHLGIPFLAANTSALPELIRPEDHEKVLFELTPGALAVKLTNALADPPPPVPSRHDLSSATDHWVRWHNDLAEHRACLMVQPRQSAANPRVTVCMAHFNQPELLEKALHSLEAQTYENFEVLVVDDGSTRPDVPALLGLLEQRISSRGWRVLRQENRYVGAARNLAAREATGEFLLFMDDDNLAKPGEIASFVRAAVRSGHDIITCPMDCFRGTGEPPPEGSHGRWIHLFLGGPVASALFQNPLGDANFFIRREVFLKLEGFTETMFVTSEDRNFLARACFAGHPILLLPEALYLYRIRNDSMFRALPYSRRTRNVLAAFESVTPPAMHDMLEYVLSLHREDSHAHSRKAALKSRQTVVDTSAASLGLEFSFGSGWHEDEGDQRWTGKNGGAATLLILAPPGSMRLDFSAQIHAADPENALQISWNGEILEESFPEGFLHLEGLPTKEGVNELRFVAKKPARSIGTDDNRELGHSFHRISFRPSHAPPSSSPRRVPDLLRAPASLVHTVRVNELPRFGGEAWFGEGWYPDEGVCRWNGVTGRRSSLFLTTPVPLTVRFQARVDWCSPGDSLTVSCPDILQTLSSPGQELAMQVRLAPGIPRRILFETALPPAPPAGSSDTRLLGCALANIEIRAVDGGSP